MESTTLSPSLSSNVGKIFGELFQETRAMKALQNNSIRKK